VKFRLLLLCAALVAAPCFAESTNRIQAVEHASAPVVATNDPVQLEYEKLMEDDDAALAEIDGWIKDNQRFAESGAAVPKEELNRRIMKRVEPIRAAYEDFLKRNPKHGNAHLAYASFLEDIHDEEAALEHMLKAKEVDPKNPAAWNNLANYYGHFGDVTNAFSHYEKAIELDPKEPVYYHNFGTTVFLFRKDVMEYYGIKEEQQVFDKALSLYSNSMRLDPTNFLLATDIAMTYYGIKPTRTEDALKSWGDALKLAEGSLQREGVMIHLARFKMNAGRYDEARADLNVVTNADLAELKTRVLRNLELREHPPVETPTNAAPTLSTNAPAGAITNAVPAPEK
jgi:tetratricopeptide (TPR) repeat protein